MRPGWTASPLDPECRRLKIGAQLGTLDHAGACPGRSDDVFRCMERQRIESKAEAGKNLTFGSALDNRNVIAARVVGQFEP